MMELQDILDAINKKLVEKWPKQTVYIDVCPVDFARPSFWLTVEQYTQTDANRYHVKREARLKLTIYDEKDEHYESSWQRLFKDAADATVLLTPPLKAAGRTVSLQIKALPRDPDAAYLQLTTSWLDNRPAADTGTEPSTAKTAQVRVEMTNR